MTTKPVVRIRDCEIIGWHPIQKLSGVPIDHPKENLNGVQVTSGAIKSREENMIETERTIYMVVNWKKD